MALEVLYGIDTGLNLTRLTEVSRLVAELSGVRTQVNKAVVGESAFRHEFRNGGRRAAAGPFHRRGL